MQVLKTLRRTKLGSVSKADHRRWLLIGAILLAVALRVNCLDCQSLWLDETISAYRAAIPLHEALRDIAENLHTPAYFVALRGWTTLAGMSPFSLRYFSFLSGILLLPVAYAVARRASRDSATAIIAVLFLALSPAHIYYAQETRMYAALPVVFVLMLGLAHHLAGRSSPTGWALLTILEVLALYLHYFSALMLIALNVVLAGVWLRRHSRRFLAYWLGSQLLVALLFMPWTGYTLRAGALLPANLTDTSGGAATFSLTAYLVRSWHFLMTGLTDVPSFLGYWSGLSALSLIAIVVPAYIYAPSHAKLTLRIHVAAVILPLLAGALIWRFNPITHPRYLFFLIGPLAILFGTSIAWLFGHNLRVVPAIASCALLLLLDASSLQIMRSDAVQQRYDAAALSAAISRRGEPQDVVLMPPGDRSLWYYPTDPVRDANWPYAGGNPQARPAQLAKVLEGHADVFLVEYEDLFPYDFQGQVPFLLEANGRLVERFTVDRMHVTYYDVSGWQTPHLAPQDVTCGPLRLTGAHIPGKTLPGDAPAIALRWELAEDTDVAWVASARLRRGQQVVSSADRSLLSATGDNTTQWAAGEAHVTYFILPLPLGGPPGRYDLEVLLYGAGSDPLVCGVAGRTALSLAGIELLEADQRSTDPYGTWSDTHWQEPPVTTLADGLALEGYSVRPDSLRPSQPIVVALRWRATGTIKRQLTPTLQLMQGDTTLASSEGDLFDRFPTSRWHEGDLLIETRQLTMPATREPLHLRMALSDESVTLKSIQVDVGALTWSVPADATAQCARFAGVGHLRAVEWLPAKDGSHASATLYWQAAVDAPSEISYTVFAQLLAPDGQVFNQDDGLPANGERPTTSWLPQEVVADSRAFDLPADDVESYLLSIGLYELATLERVRAFSCEGQRLANDALTLPLADLE